MNKKWVLPGIFILIFSLSKISPFEQRVYERRVVIKYAAPGSNPAQVDGFNYTIPEKGTYQVEIIPNRPSIAIKGIQIPIDVAVGILYEDPNGKLRRGSKRYTKGPWSHGTGDTFATFTASKKQGIRVWFSSSFGGLPSPEIGGKVRIFRVE